MQTIEHAPSQRKLGKVNLPIPLLYYCKVGDFYFFNTSRNNCIKTICVFVPRLRWKFNPQNGFLRKGRRNKEVGAELS